MFLRVSGDFINLSVVARVKLLTLRNRFCARVELVGERKRATFAVYYDRDAKTIQDALANLAVNGTEPDQVT